MVSLPTVPQPDRRAVVARGATPLTFWQALRRNPPEGFRRIASYGDLVSVRPGARRFLMVSHPVYIQSILVQQHQRFIKGRALDLARPILGQGLLTSEGAYWRRQRQLSQPTFARHAVEAYAPTVVQLAMRQVDEWQEGTSLDLSREMARLTLSIATTTLFGVEVSEAADVVREDLTWLMREIHQRLRSLAPMPTWLPTPTKLQRDETAHRLDSIIYSIIDAHEARAREGSAPIDDLLSRLMHATDAEGHGMSRRQLRDEVMTLFLAGHETTANALGWTWYLLMQNPDALATLRQELKTVLGGRPPTLEDLERLPFNRAVVEESLRLYPPAWILLRKAIEPFQLGDETFPEGTELGLSQWVTHRDPRFWPDADLFRPERWLGDGPEVPPFAYFPFGAGPRLCIGRPFALQEAELILAIMAERVTLELRPDPPVEMEALISLRTKNGIPVTVTERRSGQTVP